MVVSRAGERRPVSGTLGVPYEPLSRSDAEKAHNKQAREVVDALEHAGIVTKSRPVWDRASRARGRQSARSAWVVTAPETLSLPKTTPRRQG